MTGSAPIKVVIKELNQMQWPWPAPYQARGSQIYAARVRAVHNDPSQRASERDQTGCMQIFPTLAVSNRHIVLREVEVAHPGRSAALWLIIIASTSLK
jgi:hypothetical protein